MRHCLTTTRFITGLLLFAANLALGAGDNTAGWPLPGAQPGGGHYSTADQITPENVKKLKKVWTHRSGDFRQGANFRDGLDGGGPLQSTWQATPILAQGNLVICTPFNRIVAVAADSGDERWRYMPDITLEDYAMPRCRGVTQWENPAIPVAAACRHVIIAPLMDARVIGLDASTGERCSFGTSEQINLREGLGPHSPGGLHAEHATGHPWGSDDHRRRHR